MTKVDIISGFLGAGKTTLIKQLVTEALGQEKVVIIENDFGDASIDSSTLQRAGIEVTEIKAGCICCTLQGNFEAALLEVLALHQPDRIIIEPSGIGLLSDIMKIFNRPNLQGKLLLNGLITVVDVTKFTTYLEDFGYFYQDQIINAQAVILSRTAQVEPEILAEVGEGIAQLNNRCTIISTRWVELDMAILVDMVDSELIKGFSAAGSPQQHQPKTLTNYSVTTQQSFSLEGLQSICDSFIANHELGTILRAKGILPLLGGGWVQFDYVPGQFASREVTTDDYGRLVVIGEGLNKAKLAELFGL